MSLLNFINTFTEPRSSRSTKPYLGLGSVFPFDRSQLEVDWAESDCYSVFVVGGQVESGPEKIININQ
jgi:hypothetical protein